MGNEDASLSDMKWKHKLKNWENSISLFKWQKKFKISNLDCSWKSRKG